MAIRNTYRHGSPRSNLLFTASEGDSEYANNNDRAFLGTRLDGTSGYRNRDIRDINSEYHNERNYSGAIVNSFSSLSSNKYGSASRFSANEQRLVQSLVTENIHINGITIRFMPRNSDPQYDDTIFNEKPSSRFHNGFTIEAIIDNPNDGLGGEGTILQQYGIEFKEEIEITISIPNFSEINDQEIEQFIRNSDSDRLPLSNMVDSDSDAIALRTSMKDSDVNMWQMLWTEIELAKIAREEFNLGLDSDLMAGNIDQDMYDSDFMAYDSDGDSDQMIYSDLITSATDELYGIDVLRNLLDSDQAIVDAHDAEILKWRLASRGPSNLTAPGQVRPLEGDLFVVPFGISATNPKQYYPKFFEIAKVETYDQPGNFFQLGNNYQYHIKAKLFTLSSEGVEPIVGDTDTDGLTMEEYDAMMDSEGFVNIINDQIDDYGSNQEIEDFTTQGDGDPIVDDVPDLPEPDLPDAEVPEPFEPEPEPEVPPPPAPPAPEPVPQSEFDFDDEADDAKVGDYSGDLFGGGGFGGTIGQNINDL